MNEFFKQEAKEHFTDHSRIVKKYLIDGLRANNLDPHMLDLGIYDQ
jgi:hypothetical protein